MIQDIIHTSESETSAIEYPIPAKENDFDYDIFWNEIPESLTFITAPEDHGFSHG